jgi:hypothetical protein
VIFQNVHMHRRAVVCSTPTTQQIPAACAFAHEQPQAAVEPAQLLCEALRVQLVGVGIVALDEQQP